MFEAFSMPVKLGLEFNPLSVWTTSTRNGRSRTTSSRRPIRRAGAGVEHLQDADPCAVIDRRELIQSLPRCGDRLDGISRITRAFPAVSEYSGTDDRNLWRARKKQLRAALKLICGRKPADGSRGHDQGAPPTTRLPPSKSSILNRYSKSRRRSFGPARLDQSDRRNATRSALSCFVS